MNLWINGCLFFAGTGGALMTLGLIFLFFNELVRKLPETDRQNGRVLVTFKDGKEMPVYIEKDGVISCVYMPEKEKAE